MTKLAAAAFSPQARRRPCRTRWPAGTPSLHEERIAMWAPIVKASGAKVE